MARTSGEFSGGFIPFKRYSQMQINGLDAIGQSLFAGKISFAQACKERKTLLGKDFKRRKL